MKSFMCTVAFLLMVGVARGQDDFGGLDSELMAREGDPRVFLTNLTQSLLVVNSTLLAYALVAAAIIGAGLVALYYLYLESGNEETGYGSHGYGYNSNSYGYSEYARSAKNGFDFNSLNVIQWISMLQELYEKFDYNDLDCQKKLICEVMREPEVYGNVAQKFKSGFQYAKYLEVLSLPDDMRELLDEYLDANARADQNKACEEFFQCPFSIKESVKKNFDGNSL